MNIEFLILLFSGECRQMVRDNGFSFPQDELREIWYEAERAYTKSDWSSARDAYGFFLSDANIRNRRKVPAILRIAECNLELEEYNDCVGWTTNMLSKEIHESAERQRGWKMHAYDLRAKAYSKLGQQQHADRDIAARGSLSLNTFCTVIILLDMMLFS